MLDDLMPVYSTFYLVESEEIYVAAKKYQEELCHIWQNIEYFINVSMYKWIRSYGVLTCPPDNIQPSNIV
jgi:hypothetical protein